MNRFEQTAARLAEDDKAERSAIRHDNSQLVEAVFYRSNVIATERARELASNIVAKKLVRNEWQRDEAEIERVALQKIAEVHDDLSRIYRETRPILDFDEALVHEIRAFGMANNAIRNGNRSGVLAYIERNISERLRRKLVAMVLDYDNAQQKTRDNIEELFGAE